jgi:hypothetical protein
MATMTVEARVDPADQNRFISDYRKLLANAWSNEAFAQRLKRDPKPAMAEYGLEVPADSQVEVVAVSGSGWDEPDEQIRSWEQGLASGSYRLYLPDAPPRLDTSELSEDDLAKVDGGAATLPPIQY